MINRYAYPITCKDYKKNNDGDVYEIICEYEHDFYTSGKKTPKGVLNWIGQSNNSMNSSLNVQVRLYDLLFMTAKPIDVEDWLSNVNPNSEIIITGAMANEYLINNCKVII